MKTPKVIFIGLDGAVDVFVVNEAAKGNLPNFARFLKRGCRLTDFRPGHPAITPTCWSALQTDAAPEINGIISDQLDLGGHISNNEYGTMRALCMISGPGIPAGQVWDKPVNSIDIAPTICAKIGVPLPADSNGRVQHEFFQK